MEKKKKDSLEVTLIADHTHGGREYRKGDRLSIKRRQLKKLREWGRVK